MRIVNMLLFPGVLFVLLGAARVAYGQEEGVPSGDKERPSLRTAVGDVLHLKSGAAITGVQILRSMPRYYEVQLVEGVEPLRIPRNQVLSVEFDDYDPARERLRRELFPDSEEVSLASGERVSRYRMDKLSGPVSEEPLSYDRKDLIKILEETVERLEVKNKIHP